MKKLNKKDLINFEKKIIKLFHASKIRAPIHLHSGNEDILIKIFNKIKKNDWIFCTWRSHYHCLLKGVPTNELKREILNCKSISLCFPKYKIYSSDMTSETGIAHETIKYSINKKLPIHFIIEDNKKSVCADTRKTWSQKKLTYEKKANKYITYYKYHLKYPHAGAGKRVEF